MTGITLASVHLGVAVFCGASLRTAVQEAPAYVARLALMGLMANFAAAAWWVFR
jgi:hypothetical protein